jgi:uncharacterized C2H2 Zn-finger protein
VSALAEQGLNDSQQSHTRKTRANQKTTFKLGALKGAKKPQMTKYVVVCPSCNSEFVSYKEYVSHVFEKHEGQPSLRMQAKIIKKENSET